MKTLFKTINDVKLSFRLGNSILVDTYNDPYSVTQYLYRLERREIIYIWGESNGYIHYVINPSNPAIINYL